MYSIKVLFTSIAAACILAACGGGGGGGGSRSDRTNPDSDPSNAPQTSMRGVWTGGITDGTLNWDATSIVLEGGRTFIVSSEYYNQTTLNSKNKPGGFIVGGNTTTAEAAPFGGQEFGLEEWGTRRVTVDVTTASPQQSFNGTLSYEDGSTRNFNTTYASSYEGAANVEDIVFANESTNPASRTVEGSFYVSNGAGGARTTSLSLIVNTDGTISSRSTSTCQFSGRLEPRQDMKVFNTEITFTSGTSCPVALNTTFSGVGFIKATSQNTGPRLHLTLTSGSDTEGLVFLQAL